jgi:LytS/YehU family sensor histidine kinase
VRFGDRLQVDLRTPADTLDALVPNMMLQPLVENAVRHGMRARPLRIEVVARRAGNELEVTVRDDGAGPPPPEQWREGVGLSNLRRRLEQLYGRAQSFHFTARSHGGAEVMVRCPFRTDEPITTPGPALLAEPAGPLYRLQGG